MRAHGIKARVATMRYTSPSLQRYFGTIPNRQLDLELKRPDQVWVGDITYLKVGAIYRYLAVVMDKYSRRVVGWSYDPTKDVKLKERTAELGFTQSMNRPGKMTMSLALNRAKPVRFRRLPQPRRPHHRSLFGPRLIAFASRSRGH